MRSAIWVVQVRHGEVGVAADSYFEQMHEGNVVAPLVHRIPMPPGHYEEDLPLFLPMVRTQLLGDVVAVLDGDGYLREPIQERISQAARGMYALNLGSFILDSFFATQPLRKARVFYG